MQSKKIGIILIILGLLLAGYVQYDRSLQERFIELYVDQNGSCYLEDGTCLHEEKESRPYAFGFAIALALILFGIYLLFDKTEKRLVQHQQKVTTALRDSKRVNAQEEAFQAFLSAFEEQEQAVLRAIKAQDGIKQSTLRFKTNMSKTALSLLLKRLEERGTLTRAKEGKTNRVYLRKF